MAVPTFTSIDPAVGHPGGGQISTIIGTNFREVPGAITYPARTENTVSVTVDGVEAEMVQVLSSTELEVRIPDYRGDPNPSLVDDSVSRVSFPAVDVVITNLDDDGDAIAGETVTEADAYTYQQPLIREPGGDPPLLQVFRELLRLLKRQVVSRVALSTHTDFGVPGASFTELSEHPSLGLEMNIARDPEYSYFDNEKILVENGAEWKQYDGSKTYMLTTPVTLSSKNALETHHLNSALLDAQAATPWLIVQPDPNGPWAQVNKYPLEVAQPPEQIGGSNTTNISAFGAVLRVRGIPVVRGDPLIDRIFAITTIYLTDTDIDGANTSTIEV